MSKVVFGPRGVLKSIIERGRSADLRDGMKTALAHADLSRSVCMAIDTTAREWRGSGPASFDSVTRIINRAKYVVVGFDFAEGQSGEIVVACNDTPRTR
ncbi:MAG: hypothetical protein MI757_01090 [Pirellulales bacterium]|nr:hypothetical protein [Pirellulales bacterium]